MSALINEAEEKIIDIMKARGFEKELVIGMILCCDKMNCAQEFLEYLINHENCDDQDILNLIVEINNRD